MRASNSLLQGRARLPGPSPLPREVIEERAISGVMTVAPPASGVHVRFPRAELVLEIAGLADRCRCTAAALEALASHVATAGGTVEAGAVLGISHDVIRALFAELGKRVTFAVAVLCLTVGCAGDVTSQPEPEPEPAPTCASMTAACKAAFGEGATALWCPGMGAGEPRHTPGAWCVL